MAKPRKKDPKPDADPSEVFRQAVGFMGADNVLRTSTRSRFLITPMMVMSSFASELLFKCLLRLEGKSIPEEHNLFALFISLGLETQDRVRKRWAQSLTHPEVAAAFALADKELRNPLPRDIESALADCGDAFKKLRYLYEHRDARYYLNDLPAVLYAVVTDIKPEWHRLCFDTPPTSQAH